LANTDSARQQQPKDAMRAKLFIPVLVSAAALGAVLWSLRPQDGGSAGAKPRSEPDRSTPRAAVSAGSRSASAAQIAAALSTPALLDDRVFKEINRLKGRGRTLSAGECRCIVGLIRTAFPDVPSPRLAWIKNEALRLLLGQRNLPAPCDEVLARLFLDEALPVVIRDYALQHLFAWYGELLRGGPEPARAAALERMESVFWEAGKATDSEIAGTALLGLCSLAESGSPLAPERPKLGAAALGVLQDPAASPLSRVTALQVCARLGVTNALPIAARWAASNEPTATRCSAIAALGELGGAPEMALLARLPTDREGRLAPAVRNALKQLGARAQTSHL
jgi:hypothetical protein